MALTDENLVATPGIRSEWVTLANGAKAHYSASGDSGPPVILLHGGIEGSSGLAGWQNMMPFLGANGLRVYAPDRPGFGLADTREAYIPKNGFQDWVRFVDDFATALNLDTFHLAGNSQGAQTAAYYATSHPDRVRSCIFIATAGFNAAMGVDMSKVKPPTITWTKFDGTEESMRTLLTSILYRKEAISDDLLKMRTIAANNQRKAFTAAWDWMIRAQTDPNLQHMMDLRGKLDRTTIPGLYLYGRQDVGGPVENAYLQEDKLPNIQCFYPDECGHQGQNDQPDMFNQVFLEFFRDGKVSKKTAKWAGVSDRRPVLTHLVEQ